MTRQNTLREVSYYSAIGLGATYAKVLLKERFVFADWDKTVPVAVDVLRRVKANVSGCGNRTQIIIASGRDTNWDFYVHPAIEGYFEELDSLTLQEFDAVVAVPLDPEYKYLEEQLEELPRELRRIRAKIEEWLYPLLTEVNNVAKPKKNPVRRATDEPPKR